MPAGLAPGSDVANLTVLGYDAKACYTGRSPLEAANIGIELKEDDVAFRCNLVTLSDEADFAEKTILDYCAGDIHTADAAPLIEAVQAAFGGGEFDFYTGHRLPALYGVAWRENGARDAHPAARYHGAGYRGYLPRHPDAAPLLAMMEKSGAVLKDHPVNRERQAKGLPPANAVWLWGQGKRPALPNFKERYGVEGAMVSAVDLLKGIGRLAGMEVCTVPGATGYIDTNYEGKRRAAAEALRGGKDFAYIHVEAPDECGHRGEAANKVKAIEDIDRRILGPLLEELAEMGDFSLLVAPDHPTPLAIRTHSADPAPYLLYRSFAPAAGGPARFTEALARQTGRMVDPGYRLMDKLLGRE